ncbi:hypothetical protein Tco_0871591 [Tanacetum coccineum]
MVMKIGGCYEDVSRPSVDGVLVSNGGFELSKGGNPISTLRRDLLGDVKIPKIEGLETPAEKATSVPILEEQSK